MNGKSKKILFIKACGLKLSFFMYICKVKTTDTELLSYIFLCFYNHD